MELKLNLTNGEQKDLVSYCNLNDVLISEIIKKSFITGFNIERYGLLNSNTPQEKIVEKEVEKIVEVIKEVEVEKIVEVIKEIPGPSTEVEVVKYVDREVIKEVEIPVEVIVTKTEYVSDDSKLNELFGKIEQLEKERNELLAKPPVEKIIEVVVEKQVTDNSSKVKLDALQTTLGKIREESLEKDKKILSLEEKIKELEKVQDNKQAVYFRGSNLDHKI